ncbi:MAG TPA: glycerol kinase GlpK [Vicinamibacteria bacterium]|nr:glycerol kinase GlpK [Vicinamibacteria bacterium]
MPAAVLALDQGTTGSTALAFSHEGRVLGRAYSEFAQSYPQPGWVEHDPEEIWQVSRRVMKEALDAAGVGPGELRAIGVTNQRETTVLWERKTGRPVHPAIVWQSRQTADICEGLRREGHEAIFRERTGLVLDPYFSGTKVRWILDRYPGLRAGAAGGDVLFGTIDTWLLFRLTGGAVHATDPTNASRTLLFDIHERRWDPRLLEILDIPPAMLPEVRPSSGFFGETAAGSGLPVGVPVTGIAGDQQAALFGQGCWEPGLAKNTYGTGCFVMMNMGGKRLKSTGGLLATLCCDATGKPVYALEGSIFIAGAAVQWLRDELGLIGNAAETEAIAAGLKDTGGVYVVPAFAGLGAPYWDMGARGAIVGLTRGAGRRQLVRATLESIAYQTRDVIDVMNVESGIPVQELRVDGGGAANGFLMQFQADMLGVPVDRPALVETTAAGAAFLAGLGVGFWENPEVLRGVRRRERLFQPQMTEGEREKLYAGWKRAVQRVRTAE